MGKFLPWIKVGSYLGERELIACWGRLHCHRLSPQLVHLDHGRLVVSFVPLHVYVAVTLAASMTAKVVPAVESCTAVLAEDGFLKPSIDVAHMFHEWKRVQLYDA